MDAYDQLGETIVGPTPKGDDPYDALGDDLPTFRAAKRSLGERFSANAHDAFAHGTLVGAAGGVADAALADASIDPGAGVRARERQREDRDAYEREAAADPWYKADGGFLGRAAAGAATLGGQVVGSLPSPESWIGAPEAMAEKAGAYIAGRTGLTKGVADLAGRLLTHGGANAAVAGATDPAVQGLENISGGQTGYDPTRTVSSAAVGFGLPLGFEAAGSLGRMIWNTAGEAVGRAMKSLAPEPHETPRPANDAYDTLGETVASPPKVDPRTITYADTGEPVSPPMQAAYEELRRTGRLDPAAAPGSAAKPAPAREGVAREPGDYYVGADGRVFQEPPATSAEPSTTVSEVVVNAPKRAQGPTQVYSPAGKPLDVSYEVRDIRDLKASHGPDLQPNPDYPAELQPRDRTRAASEAQVSSIARDLQPAMLGETPDLATGAPMVGPDGAVESGNGRVIALGRLYDAEHPNADAYRSWLTEQGYPVEGVERPVLIRKRETELSPEERVSWAQAANERSTGAMSASEQAKTDAGKLTPEVLDSFKGGALDSAANAPFVGSVLQKISSEADRGALVDGYGRVSAEGVRRARAALTQHAYGDGELIARLYEDPRPELGGLGKAVQEAAPTWAGMRAAAAAGAIPRELDATPALNEALALVRQSREGRLNLREVFSTKDAFEPRDPRVEQFARLFFNDDDFRRVRSAQAVQKDLESYAGAAREAASGALFGETGDQLSSSILDGLTRRARGAAARADEQAGVGGFDFGKAAMREAKPAREVDAALVRAELARLNDARPGVTAHKPGPFGPVLRGLGERWGDVVETLHRLQGGEAEAALYHPEVGHIDVPWGEERVQGAGRKPEVEGYGLAKIAQLHPDVVPNLPERLAQMKPYRRGENRVRLRDALTGAEATISLNHFGQAKTWLLTAYEPKERARQGTDGTMTVARSDRRDDYPGELAMRSLPQEGGQGQRRPDTYDLHGETVREPDAYDRLGEAIDPPDLLASRAGRGLREAPRPAPVAAGSAKEASAAAFKGKTVSALSDDLRQALGITHRQGRIGLRGALGTYDLRTGVVRTKQVHELDVLSHEVFHKLEFEDALKLPSLQAALKAHAGELSAMAYPGAAPGTHREEGFAEFGRWYLTNPDHARREAPTFFPAFEAALKKDRPELLSKLQAVQQGYRAYLAAPSAASAAASLVSERRDGQAAIKRTVEDLRADAKATVGRFMDRAYTAAVDDLNPLRQGVRRLLDLNERNTGKKLDLKVADDPYKLARLSRAAFAAGHQDLIHGVHPYGEIAPQGPSLAGALEKALGAKSLAWSRSAIADFGQYLVSRRMVHEWERYEAGDLPKPPDRTSGAYHGQVVRDLDAAHPEWAAAAKDIYAWNDQLWRKEFDAGLISENTFKAGAEKPDYVPLMRDMSDRERAGGRPTRSNQRYAGGSKRFQGSTRDVINPIESMMKRSYDLSAVIARNDTIKALQTLGERVGRGAGEIVERLPETETTAVKVDAIEALRAAAREAGVDTRDVTTLVEAASDLLGGETSAKVFQAGKMNERGEPIVFVWHDGAPVPLRLANGLLGKEMFDAITGMNKEQQSWVLNLLSLPARALRYGVTADPNFASINFLRDQVATWINTDVGFKPALDGLRGLGSEIKHGDTARMYNAAGGISGGANVSALPKARLQRDVQALREKGLTLDRVNPLKRFSELSEISETGTRLGVFAKALEKAKARGLNDREAALEAAYIARDTLDFDRSGAQMQTFRRVIPFMNASLQGLDKAARVLSGDGDLKKVLSPLWGAKPLVDMTDQERRALKHAWSAWAKIGALGVAGLALSAMHHGDQDYQEIDDTTRATYWIGPKLPNGDFIKIPKPFELAALSNIFERAFERIADKNPKAWDRMWKGLNEILVPAHTSPIATLPLEVAANRDHFGKPIVPDRLKGAQVEDQAQPTTTGLARTIGGMLHMSPAVVEHVLTSGGGGLGRSFFDVLKGMEKRVTMGPDATRMPIARRLLKNPNSGATATDDFFRLTNYEDGELTQHVGSVGLRVNAGDAKGAERLIRGLKPYERDYVIASELLPMKDRLNHPLYRAAAAGRIVSEVRRNVQGHDIRGVDGSEVKLTPEKRTELVRSLEGLNVVMQRNALIRAGVEGWSQFTPGATAVAMERVRAASPEAAAILEARWAERTRGKNGHPKAPSEEEAAREWPRIEAQIGGAVDTPGKLYEQLRQRLFLTPDGRKNPRSRFRPGEPVETVH